MEFEIENSEPNDEYNYDSVNEIPLIDASTLTYHNFFKNFILKNVPCIIKNITNQWQASHHWVKDYAPNFVYLLEKYGHNRVTIYNCNERYYNSQKTHESVFSDYLEYWQKYGVDSTLPLEYLKDWHLKRVNENDEFYDVPIHFASDWLNEYYTACLNDDYRFVYMGIKNTWYIYLKTKLIVSKILYSLGHLFMQMFSHRTAGPQMFMVEKSGCFSLQVKRTF